MWSPLTSSCDSAEARELEDVEDRQGPFTIAGQDFMLVRHYKRLPYETGLDSQALVSLEIRDGRGDVQYQQSFPHQIEKGMFTETCSADVRLIAGSGGKEGWIHTPEDLNAIGLFASG